MRGNLTFLVEAHISHTGTVPQDSAIVVCVIGLEKLLKIRIWEYLEKHGGSRNLIVVVKIMYKNTTGTGEK